MADQSGTYKAIQERMHEIGQEISTVGADIEKIIKKIEKDRKSISINPRRNPARKNAHPRYKISSERFIACQNNRITIKKNSDGYVLQLATYRQKLDDLHTELNTLEQHIQKLDDDNHSFAQVGLFGQSTDSESEDEDFTPDDGYFPSSIEWIPDPS